MSGPFPEDLKVTVDETATRNDPRQIAVSKESESFAETHRGINPETGKAGSGKKY